MFNAKNCLTILKNISEKTLPLILATVLGNVNIAKTEVQETLQKLYDYKSSIWFRENVDTLETKEEREELQKDCELFAKEKKDFLDKFGKFKTGVEVFVKKYLDLRMYLSALESERVTAQNALINFCEAEKFKEENCLLKEEIVKLKKENAKLK